MQVAKTRTAFRHLVTILLIAICLPIAWANAAKDVLCPTASTLTYQQLFGDWQVVWQDHRADGSTQTSAPEPVHFGRNPEFPESLSGELRRAGRDRVAPLQLAGDVEDGQLTLEESPDGKAISATWVAQLDAASCGKRFTGTWKRDDDAITSTSTSTSTLTSTPTVSPAQRQFTLRRVPGW